MDRCPHCNHYDMNLDDRGYCIHCLKEVRPTGVRDDDERAVHEDEEAAVTEALGLATPPPSPPPSPPVAAAPTYPAAQPNVPERPITISVSQLDPQTLQYLHEIDRTSGRDVYGVFDRRSGPWFVGPRGGRWFFLMVALLLFGVLALVTWGVVSSEHIDKDSAVYQSILAGVAALFLLVSISRFRRPASRYPLGSFLYADALFLWEVTPSRVTATSLTNLTDADGTHRFANGAYSRSEIRLKFSYGSRQLTVVGKHDAERLFQFLQWVSGLRNSQHAHVRAWAAALPPGQLTVAVNRLAQQGNNADVSNLPNEPDPPVPQRVAADSSAGAPKAVDTLARLCCGAAVGVLAFVGFPYANSYLQDEALFHRIPARDDGMLREMDIYLHVLPHGRHADEVREKKDEFLFARIPERDDGSIKAVATMDNYIKDLPKGRHIDQVQQMRDDRYFARIPAQGGFEQMDQYLKLYPDGRHTADVKTLRDDRYFAQIPAQGDGGFEQMAQYLKLYPEGRHTAEVKVMRDDRRFSQAKTGAVARNGPAPLRDYLKDAVNQRHRAEAENLVAGYYDRTIADLKTKQAKGKPEDKELYDAIFSLLESLKHADRPVVTVGFKASFDKLPTTDFQKQVEKLAYERHLKELPELKTIAGRQPDGSAILGTGDAFSQEQNSRRERVILDRLRTAVAKGISSDILTLEAVPAGEKPMLEVDYHIYPDGTLGPYTKTSEDILGKKTKTLLGLLRWYSTDWVIVVRSLGEKKEASFRLQSRPVSQLHYTSEEGDPTWAIYAVMLYSGFYDMSASLIRSFGLDPGPAPNTFTFDAVASTKPDEPDTPDLPFKPRPKPFPFPDR